MQNRPVERRIRVAAVLILIGLLIEAATLRILHPISFIVFAGAGVLFLGAGIVVFLLALLREGEAQHGEGGA
jgi:hypothetical protein